MTENRKSYEEMYEMEHPTSRRHPRMPREARAAQFAPFAALTGYEAVLSEANRRTEEEVELAQGREELPEIAE